MKRLLPAVFASLIGFGLLAGFSASAQFEQELSGLQKEWNELSAVEPDARQAEALKALALKAGKLAQRYPDKLEPRVWEAMILSSYAQATGRYDQVESIPEITQRLQVEKALRQGGNNQI